MGAILLSSSALAGGAQSAPSWTVPVIIVSYSISSEPGSRPDGVFVCADGSGAFIESVPGALRLTRLGRISTLRSSALTRDAEGRLTLKLKGAWQTCRPATPGDAVLRLGTPQLVACVGGQRVMAVPFAQAVLLTSFRNGQDLNPHLSGLMPQINAKLYQNSNWTWRSAGNAWKLTFHGKAVATSCRLRP